MSRRRSKYPNIGILDFFEDLVSGGGSRVAREDLYKKTSKEWDINRELFGKRLHSLKQQGLVKYSREYEIILTEKGTQRIDFLRLEKLAWGKKKDGFWRVVIFDIPETKKYARKLLRDKLVEFDCYQLQKSVYATPYICEYEIGEICKLLDVSRNIQIITAKHLGVMESRVRKHFVSPRT